MAEASKCPYCKTGIIMWIYVEENKTCTLKCSHCPASGSYVAAQQSFAPDVCPACDGATVVLSSFGGIEDCVECAGTGKRR